MRSADYLSLKEKCEPEYLFKYGQINSLTTKNKFNIYFNKKINQLVLSRRISTFKNNNPTKIVKPVPQTIHQMQKINQS